MSSNDFLFCLLALIVMIGLTFVIACKAFLLARRKNDIQEYEISALKKRVDNLMEAIRFHSIDKDLHKSSRSTRHTND